MGTRTYSRRGAGGERVLTAAGRVKFNQVTGLMQGRGIPAKTLDGFPLGMTTQDSNEAEAATKYVDYNDELEPFTIIKDPNSVRLGGMERAMIDYNLKFLEELVLKDAKGLKPQGVGVYVPAPKGMNDWAIWGLGRSDRFKELVTAHMQSNFDVLNAVGTRFRQEELGKKVFRAINAAVKAEMNTPEGVKISESRRENMTKAINKSMKVLFPEVKGNFINRTTRFTDPDKLIDEQIKDPRQRMAAKAILEAYRNTLYLKDGGVSDPNPISVGGENIVRQIQLSTNINRAIANSSYRDNNIPFS
jgi:hypothetical protein